MGGSSLGGTPLGDSSFPTGAVFQLTYAPEQSLSVRLDEHNAEVRYAAGSKNLVVRLAKPADSYRYARGRALALAQRALDLLSVQNIAQLAITALTVEESSFVWWQSNEHGQVLRRMTVIPFDLSVLRGHPAIEAIFKNVDASLHGSNAWRGPAKWHPSFRFYRSAQLSADRLNAFRSTFLATESVLDEVLPFNRAGMRDKEWWPAALEKALQDVSLGPRFGEGHESPIDYVSNHLYNLFRSTTFHGRSSEGSLRLPHIDNDDEAEELDRALSDLGYLYVVLAKKHLGATFPVGFGVFHPGFMMMTESLVGRFTIHVTDDQAPSNPETETLLNPRGARIVELRTRDAKRLESRFRRMFIGVGDPAGLATAIPVIRGLKATVGGEPFAWSDFEADLVLDGFDRFEAVMGIHGVNPTDRRRRFDT